MGHSSAERGFSRRECSVRLDRTTDCDQIRLVCFQCGKIEEPGGSLLDPLRRDIAEASGFSANVVRMELGGLCRDCSG